jgi:hypothetical protein
MIGSAPGLSTGAYGLLHERGPDAVVAEVGDPGAADVVVGRRVSDWNGAVRALAAVLAEGALGVLVVDRGGRRRARRALKAAGLTARAEVLLHPSGDRPVRLASLDRDVLVRPGRRARGVRGALLRALPLGVVARLRATALVVERGGSRSYGAWLEALVPDADPRRVIAERTDARAGVLTVWPARGPEPTAFVKVGAVDAEARALETVAPGAASAGVGVPRVLGRSVSALATTPLGGSPAALRVAERPESLGEVAGRIVAWLARWHERTAAPRRWAAADTERYVVRPLDVLDGLLAPSYEVWLRARADAFEGEVAPFAPAHGDLTLANVLLDGETVGVIDWEEATEAAPPLVDLPYALADAAAARQRYADRPAAFSALFGPGGADAELASALLARATADLAIEPAALSLSFHACWLHHAANDVRRDVSGRPFVRIAAAVAADPERYDPFLQAR